VIKLSEHQQLVAKTVRDFVGVKLFPLPQNWNIATSTPMR